MIVEIDHMGRSVKSQFKFADKLGAKYVITIGEDELNKGVATLKDMQSGEGQDVKLEISDILEKINGKN